MTDREQCSLCTHIGAKKTCECSESPYFEKTVDAGGRCDSFVLSFGAESMMNGLLKSLETGSAAAGIPDFERALEYRLLEEDELSVRFGLAEGYREIVGNSDSPAAEMAKMPATLRAFDELERAAAIDQKGGYGYFEDRLNRARLFRANFLYMLMADAIADEKGPEAGIAFIEKKLQVFRYLPSTPMIYLIEYQSKLYLKCGQKEAAKECLKTILGASPLDPVDEQGKEKDLRGRVSSTLQSLEPGRTNVEGAELPKSPLAAKAGLTSAIIGLFFGGIVLGPVAMFLGFRAMSQLAEAKAVKGKKMAVAAMIIGGLVTIFSLIGLSKVLFRH
jgi:hypothetical protein